METLARAILGGMEHDCPGCLHVFIRNITVTEAETKSKLVAWDVKNMDGDDLIRLTFADRLGRVVEEMIIETPNH